MRRLVIHFARFGPYHRARLSAAADVMRSRGWEVIGLQTAASDATYSWDESGQKSQAVKIITAFPGRVHEEIRAAECRRVMYPLLDKIKPDAVAIAGWSTIDAGACLSWCRRNDVRRIVMSETREADGRRVWWKEAIKRYLISRFDGALVGGSSHRDYLVKLGMPANQVHLGYDVVDNAYFEAESDRWRTAPARQNSTGIPQSVRPFFLASNRFVKRKNLVRLVEAYAHYCANQPSTHSNLKDAPRTKNQEPGTTNSEQGTKNEERRTKTEEPFPWDLCLLGDGELRAHLVAQCHRLGLTVVESAPWERPSISDLRPRTTGTVYFPGFRQVRELPKFYAHAQCFVHPALAEPWGLVINEAMACGLPILSSRNVGAAEELIEEGVNGYCFNPLDVLEIADYLTRVSSPGFALSEFSSASRRILAERAPLNAFGEGLMAALQSGAEFR